MSSSPHDALFKSVFGDVTYARAELASVLPVALSQRIDWASLALLPGSFVDEALSSSESDLLFEARCGGAELRLHLLFEHQSTADPRMPFRLLRYMVRIWEREEVLVPIVPVVLHHSEAGWNTARTFDEVLGLGRFQGTGIEPYVPRFTFLLDDVSQMSDTAIASRVDDVMVRLSLAALRESRRAESPRQLIERLAALMREVVHSQSSGDAYLRVLRYLLQVAASDDPRPFLDAVADEVGTTTKEQAMGLLDAMLEKGIAKGKAEGQLEAQRRTAEKLLQLKFGPLADLTRERIARMDGDALDVAIERILDAQKLEDVIG